MIDVGERLKELMDERGLNMHALSKKAGVSWNTIKNFYDRRTKPTITTISMLCDGLGITLAQFFDVEGETVHLTAEQQYVIDCWSALTDKEKEAMKVVLEAVLENRKQKDS